MLRQIKTFLALRALGYSPREAKRILDIARRSRLEFEDSINLPLSAMVTLARR